MCKIVYWCQYSNEYETLLLLRNNGINHLVLELLTNFYYTWLDIWIQKACKNCPKVSDQNTLRIHGYGITAQKLQNIMMHRFVLFLVHHTPSSCFWIFSQLTFFEKSQLKFIVWKKIFTFPEYCRCRCQFPPIRWKFTWPYWSKWGPLTNDRLLYVADTENSK